MIKKLKLELTVLACMLLVIVTAGTWLNHEHDNAELTAFLHTDPWTTMRQQQPIAIPHLTIQPNHPPAAGPNDWTWTVDLPAGYWWWKRMDNKLYFCQYDAHALVRDVTTCWDLDQVDPN